MITEDDFDVQFDEHEGEAMPYGKTTPSYAHKVNCGSAFDNAEHKQSDKHPDFRGSINVAGTIYWISAWKNTSESGKRYLSLKLTPQEERDDHVPIKPTSGKTARRNDW